MIKTFTVFFLEEDLWNFQCAEIVLYEKLEAHGEVPVMLYFSFLLTFRLVPVANHQ